MSPRPYRLGRRQEAVDATRERIVAAARELLLGDEGTAGFSIEAIARRAEVARMTVYHRFGSKRGVLEGVLDAVARGGGIERLEAAFREPDPERGLAMMVEVFARFFGSDRPLFRRLHALAALDPELGRALQERQERRRHGVRILIERLTRGHAEPDAGSSQGLIDLISTLMSFETFESIAGPDRQFETAVPVVQRGVRALVRSFRAVSG